MKRTFYPEPISALEVFEPAAGSIYSIEQAAHLAGVPRRAIAVYFSIVEQSGANSPPLSGPWGR